MFQKLTTKLGVLFFVLNIIVFGTFFAVVIFLGTSLEEKSTEEYMDIMLSDKTETLQSNLKSVENEARDFAEMAGSTDNLDYYKSIFAEGYFINDQGVLEGKSHRTSVYLPKGTVITEEIKREVAGTESLMSLMETISRNNNDATTYITTENGVLRVYPYLDSTVFDPALDQKTGPFYQIANEDNNPEREAKWTKPYYDYAGFGWIVTCSAPYYDGDEFKGVVSIDLPLESLYGTLKSFQMGEKGFAFAIDYEGNIIYHPKMAKDTDSHGEIYENKYADLYGDDSNRQSIFKQMLTDDGGYLKFHEAGEGKVIAFKKLNYIDWIIGIEVNTSEMTISNKFLPAGVWLTLILSFVLVLFTGLIISRKITKPITKLTEEVQGSDEEQLSKVTVGSDDEIGVLATSFNNMVERINENTSSLMETNSTLQSVFDAVSDTLMVIDEELNIIKCNKVSDNEIKAHSKCYRILHGQEEPCRGCPVLRPGEKQGKCTVINGNNIFGVTAYKVPYEQYGNTHYVVSEIEETQNVLLEKELMQKEKMAEVGRLVAGLTHELKNPLSVIKGCSYLLNTSDSENREIAIEIDESVARANKIVMNMLNFSKADYEESKAHNVRTHIDQILMLLREDLVDKKISYDVNIPEDLEIYCKGDSLKHIFINIISNAIEAMDVGGHLSITGAATRDYTEIIVKDNGIKIDAERMEHILEPFVTTKEQGTGLGLWIVSNEVKKYDGEMEIANVSDGVQVTIRFKNDAEWEERDEQSQQ